MSKGIDPFVVKRMTALLIAHSKGATARDRSSPVMVSTQDLGELVRLARAGLEKEKAS